MKYGIIGLVVMFMVVAGGIVLYTGSAGESKTPEGPAVEIPQTSTATPEMMPTTTATPIAAPEKVSAEALTCTIVTATGYEVDLRLKNPGPEARTVTINPPGRIVVLSPGQTKRVDILLANEGTTLNIQVDDGTELSIQSPPCINRGGSTGSVSSLAPEELPVPPVPELPTLALVSTGIFGLLLVSRKRND